MQLLIPVYAEPVFTGTVKQNNFIGSKSFIDFELEIPINNHDALSNSILHRDRHIVDY